MNSKQYNISAQSLRSLKPLVCPKKRLTEEAFSIKMEHFFSKGKLNARLIDAVAFIENHKATLAKLQKRAQRAQRQYQQLDHFIEQLSQAVVASMEHAGLKQINGEQFSLTIRKTQSKVQIEDPQGIDPTFYQTQTIAKLNKAMIKGALLKGLEVQGASLKDVISLKIQR